MEIDYRCNRCNKTVRARVSIQVFKGKARKRNGRLTKEHCRVDCLECKRYIKFIGEGELGGLYPNWRDEITEKRTPVKKPLPGFKKKKRGVSSAKIIENQAELNFKLDLIIDHLGIREDSFIKDYGLTIKQGGYKNDGEI